MAAVADTQVAQLISSCLTQVFRSSITSHAPSTSQSHSGDRSDGGSPSCPSSASTSADDERHDVGRVFAALNRRMETWLKRLHSRRTLDGDGDGDGDGEEEEEEERESDGDGDVPENDPVDLGATSTGLCALVNELAGFVVVVAGADAVAHGTTAGKVASRGSSTSASDMHRSLQLFRQLIGKELEATVSCIPHAAQVVHGLAACAQELLAPNNTPKTNIIALTSAEASRMPCRALSEMADIAAGVCEHAMRQLKRERDEAFVLSERAMTLVQSSVSAESLPEAAGERHVDDLRQLFRDEAMLEVAHQIDMRAAQLRAMQLQEAKYKVTIDELRQSLRRGTPHQPQVKLRTHDEVRDDPITFYGKELAKLHDELEDSLLQVAVLNTQLEQQQARFEADEQRWQRVADDLYSQLQHAEHTAATLRQARIVSNQHDNDQQQKNISPDRTDHSPRPPLTMADTDIVVELLQGEIHELRQQNVELETQVIRLRQKISESHAITYSQATCERATIDEPESQCPPSRCTNLHGESHVTPAQTMSATTTPPRDTSPIASYQREAPGTRSRSADERQHKEVRNVGAQCTLLRVVSQSTTTRTLQFPTEPPEQTSQQSAQEQHAGELGRDLDALREELSAARAAHVDELETLRGEHEAETQALKRGHGAELKECRKAFKFERAALEARLADAEAASYELSRLRDLQATTERQLKAARAQLSALEASGVTSAADAKELLSPRSESLLGSPRREGVRRSPPPVASSPRDLL